MSEAVEPIEVQSETSELLKKYDFQWDVLDVIVGGKSLLDMDLGLSGFPMRSSDDADLFLSSYGYSIQDPIEQAELLGNFQEAVAFIRKNFLQPENPEGLKLELPRKILELTDVRDLLLMASMSFPGQMKDTQGDALRNWACALLKVIHAIAHIDKDVRVAYFSDIQKQIFDRFYKFIHRDDQENLFLGEKTDDPKRIELVEFQTKPKKSRESVLLKVLHKPESVADDIFDRVGIRFITKDKIGALRVLKYLKDKMIIMPANIKSSRSRNSLVDLDGFKAKLTELVAKFQEGTVTSERFEATLAEVAQVPPPKAENPHSSQFYRAIQFTSRQLIKLRNPLFDNVKQIISEKKKTELPEEISKLIDKLDLKYLKKDVRFFYPFEVQVVDRESHEENERGRSSHSEYKKSQIQTAMKRVMGSLMNVT